MDLNKYIFREYDIRGKVSDDFPPEVVESLGKGFGTFIKRGGGQEIALSGDVRLTTPDLIQQFKTGVLSTGVDVINIGILPTPANYFSMFHLDVAGAVQITGSHNPPEFNGFKMSQNKKAVFGESIQDIRTLIEKQDYETGEGSEASYDILSKYKRMISSKIDIQKRLKVVMDCGNAAGAICGPDIFKNMNVDLTELFCDVDGTFPNHHPDPSQLENLNDLIETVIATKADFGMALDGDGDRLGVVSGTGDIIFADRQLLLFARDVLSRNPGAEIIYDVKCSKVLPDAIRESGGLPTMWKTGHSFIKAKLKESGAILAGEMSGHIFFKERWYGFDDGIYAAARLCELLSAQDDPPTAVFKSIPELVSTPELRLEMEEGEHHALVEQFVRNARFPTGEICTIDGIRVDFKTGFGLARASNTTSTVILRFEADRQQQLTEIQEQFRTQLLALQPELKLPF
jgi:phosphomannomutase/phosphoglucomutase